MACVGASSPEERSEVPPGAGAAPEGGGPEAGEVASQACAGASPRETAGVEGVGEKVRRTQELKWGHQHSGEEELLEPVVVVAGGQDRGRMGWELYPVKTGSSANTKKR